jgi:trehalose 6-phosphate synthase
MPRLVIVSNRVPDLNGRQPSGGLAVAILDALRDNGGLWFGWNGLITRDAKPVDAAVVNEHGALTLATVALSEKDYEEYYLGFSNSAIWPVFHNRLDLAKFDPAQVEGYRRVNIEFAKQLSPLLRASDLIWIHDYHLIPLAAHLRVRGHHNPIGFFLHISFPSPDVLVAAPEHEWLMDSFLSYDLVGFQTASDAGNFHRFLLNFEGTSQSENKLVARGRTIVTGVFPIGIDVEAFAAMAHTQEAEEQIQRLHRRATARVHIIGVDRLDYTKGLPGTVAGILAAAGAVS